MFSKPSFTIPKTELDLVGRTFKLSVDAKINFASLVQSGQLGEDACAGKPKFAVIAQFSLPQI